MRRLWVTAAAALALGCSDSAGPDFSSAPVIFQDLGSGNHDIFSVTQAGTGVVPLAATAGDEYHAAISPDRQTIAYVRDNHLWLMNVDGTGQHPVPNINVEAAFPAWSRDGSLIAFRSQRTAVGGGWAVFVVTPGGTGLKQISNLDHGEGVPSWTADGRVVFDDVFGYLYVVKSDGTGLHYLLADTSTIDNDPAVSPDGTRIALTRGVVINGVAHTRIVVANLDGTNAKTVSSFAAGNDNLPAWSPDGTRIVFSHDEDPSIDLYVVNVDGTSQHLLLHKGGASYRAAW